eukprot:Em0023g330a
MVLILVLSTVFAAAQLECPDTSSYCPGYNTNLRTGAVSLKVTCSQTHINVTVTNNGGKGTVSGGLLEYSCTSSKNVVCKAIVRGVLQIKNYTIQTTLQPGAQCVVFGCYHIIPSTLLYGFVEAHCNVSVITKVLSQLNAAIRSLSPTSNSVVALMPNLSSTTGVGLTPTALSIRTNLIPTLATGTPSTASLTFNTASLTPSTGVILTPITASLTPISATVTPTSSASLTLISTALTPSATPCTSADLTPSKSSDLTPNTSAGLTPSTSAGLTPSNLTPITASMTPSTASTTPSTAHLTPIISATLTPSTASWMPVTSEHLSAYTNSTTLIIANPTESTNVILTVSIEPALKNANVSMNLTPSTRLDLTPINNVDLTPSNKVDLTPSNSVDLTPSNSMNLTPSNSVDLTHSNSVRSYSVDLIHSNTVDLTPSNSVRLTPSKGVGLTPSNDMDLTPSNSVDLTPSNSVDITHNNSVDLTLSNSVGLTSSNDVDLTPSNSASLTPSNSVDLSPSNSVKMNQHVISTPVVDITYTSSVHNAIPTNKPGSTNVETPVLTLPSPITALFIKVLVIIGAMVTILAVLGSMLLLIIIIKKIREKKRTNYNQSKLSQLSFAVDLEGAHPTKPDHHQGSSQPTSANHPQEAFAEKVLLDVFDDTASETSLQYSELSDRSSHSSRSLQHHLTEEQGDIHTSSFNGSPSNSTITSENALHVSRERVILDSTFSDTSFTDEFSCEADLVSNTCLSSSHPM